LVARLETRLVGPFRLTVVPTTVTSTESLRPPVAADTEIERLVGSEIVSRALAVPLLSVRALVTCSWVPGSLVAKSTCWFSSARFEPSLTNAVIVTAVRPSDPIVGALSDRWHSRWGRRRPWLLAGLPLMLVAMFQLFLPPADAGPAHLLGWTLALYLGWTIVLLPYAAWGAELSGDYNERSRIVGAREACIVVGTVLAAALPSVLPLLLDDVSGDARAESLAAIAWFCLIALPLTVGAALLFVPEPAPAATGRVALLPGLRLIASNAPFRRLLIVYLLNGTANGMTATLFLLFVSHVLQLPEQAGPLLLAYFVSGVVSVPIWVAVS